MSDKSTLVRRALIQSTLAPAVESALKGIEQLDLSRPEDARRLMRALVRIGTQLTMSKGHAPDMLAAACIEAVGREVESRVQTFVETAPAQTQPAESFPC